MIDRITEKHNCRISFSDSHSVVSLLKEFVTVLGPPGKSRIIPFQNLRLYLYEKLAVSITIITGSNLMFMMKKQKVEKLTLKLLFTI